VFFAFYEKKGGIENDERVLAKEGGEKV